MNAAARLVHQNVLTNQLIIANLFTRRQLGVMTLALAILMSAMSIIYVTHLTRVLHAGYQRNIIEQGRLQVERGQLLLERSTWMVQARIQQLAEKQLEMFIPDQKSVVIIHE